jgi:hypothetical protein
MDYMPSRLPSRGKTAVISLESLKRLPRGKVKLAAALLGAPAGCAWFEVIPLKTVARKYVLTPGGIRNYLMNLRLLVPMHYYHAQSAEKGLACVIDVLPEHAELLSDDC